MLYESSTRTPRIDMALIKHRPAARLRHPMLRVRTALGQGLGRFTLEHVAALPAVVRPASAVNALARKEASAAPPDETMTSDPSARR